MAGIYHGMRAFDVLARNMEEIEAAFRVDLFPDGRKRTRGKCRVYDPEMRETLILNNKTLLDRVWLLPFRGGSSINLTAELEVNAEPGSQVQVELHGRLYNVGVVAQTLDPKSHLIPMPRG
jgi:hypothetical protein